MARAGARCFSLLLLLLALWVAELPVSAKPKCMTPAQWFQTQHVQPKPQACNSAMGHISQYTKRCKPLNTFLHTSFSSVAATCLTPSKTCKNGQKNCHQSPKPVSLTVCKHTTGQYPNCRYKETHLNASYIVACDPPQKKDSGESHLLPVHLDEVI
ncbi:PREDICTED: ribonuclease 7 [Chinchilla lanigera]|uniref:ribonuclease 7 n=1 Tax=Chinchilla lanigera TaxID=34839 RepID=UPI00038E9E1E|nr:PREDICTED: ribonuclease 7 [Chinchilla lanigera]XP_013364028.1 PREDICTED: ribonuclease 7 [Chinchilla lanigera]